MLLPVLNIESTAQELVNLCRLLNSIQTRGDDLDQQWKVARLLSMAEELKEAFVDEYELWHVEASSHYKDLSQQLAESDKTETLLSFAFNSAATIDSARFQSFEPDAHFRNTIKSIRKETLHLLHEKRYR